MIGFFLKRRISLFSIYAIIFVLGITSLVNLPIELYPEVETPKLKITVYWNGISPETMEKEITRKIESAAFTMKGIKDVNSYSRRSQSEVTVEFERGIDLNYQEVLLKESLSLIDFPNGCSPPQIEQESPEEFESTKVPFIISVYGPYSIGRMGEIAEDIKGKLERTKGVKRVKLYGGERSFLNIKIIHPEITIFDIIEELSKKNLSGGEIESEGKKITITFDYAISPVDLENIIIKGQPLKEIAECSFVQTFPSYATRINGNPRITLNVEKREDAGLLEVSRRLRDNLKKSAFPPEVEVEFTEDEANEIRKAMKWIGLLGIISIIGVSLALFSTTRNKFSILIFFLTILFSSLLTIILLYFTKLSLNILTLSGIALGFGLVVDNSIIVMENILRLKEDRIIKAEEKGASKVFLPVIAATLTTISVYIPFLFLQENSRMYYIPFALSSTYTLLSSIFVSFTLTPFLTKKLQPKFSYKPQLYKNILRKLLNYKYLVLSFSLLLIGSGIYIFNNYVYKGELWGFNRPNSIYIGIRPPEGSNREEIIRIIERFEEEIKKDKEHEKFYTTISQQYSSIRINFSKITNEAYLLKEKLINIATDFANCRIYIIGLDGEPFFTGGGIGVIPELSLRGYNYYHLIIAAEKIKNKLEQNPRIKNVDMNFSWYGHQKEYVITPNNLISLYGLTPAEALGELIQDVSFPFLLGNEMINLRIFRDTLLSASEILNLPVRKGIQLNNIAEVYHRVSPGEIKRKNQEYEKVISYEYRGPYKMANNFKKTFVNATHMPEGFSLQEYSFSEEEEGIGKKEIIITVCLALFLLMAILSSLYESYLKPLLILLVIPISFFGVSLIYFTTGINFDTSAFVGLILLTGIAVNDGIVLIDHLSRGKKQDIEDIIERAGHRFRPIIITTLTTLAGLLPFVFVKGDLEIFSKLSLSCIGGLVFSTLGSLAVLPIAYFILFGKRNEKQNID